MSKIMSVRVTRITLATLSGTFASCRPTPRAASHSCVRMSCDRPDESMKPTWARSHAHELHPVIDRRGDGIV